MASSSILFFSYQDDSRSIAHQICFRMYSISVLPTRYRLRIRSSEMFSAALYLPTFREYRLIFKGLKLVPIGYTQTLITTNQRCASSQKKGRPVFIYKIKGILFYIIFVGKCMLHSYRMHGFRMLFVNTYVLCMGNPLSWHGYERNVTSQ